MKHILIVGATSAIASACARLWAKDGARFFLVARNGEKLAQTAADLTARGATGVATHIMDANSIEEHAAMLEACARELPHLDLVLIAHGTLPDQSACEQRVDTALREFATNGTSVIALLTLLANHLASQRSGTLAVISSVAGDRGRPSNYLYGSAKAAVSVFCQGMRARVAQCGVHLITIKPGFVATPMTRDLPLPGPLVASPEQVARRITKGIAKRRNTLYVPGFWALIMLAIRLVPEPLFKRLKL